VRVGGIKMRKRKISMRKSVVTNKIFPKKELLRIVKTKEGRVSIDPTGKANGRGAYLALDLEEVEKAKSKKVFDKVFSQVLDEKFYNELKAYVEHILARRELFKENE
jgi:predicted RNA-binding protein YlxR (DUF448 family)